MANGGSSIWWRLTVALFLLQGSWLTIHAFRLKRTAQSDTACPQGWDVFGNKCYRMFGSQTSERETWTEANRKCTEMGSTQVSIHSTEEQEFIATYVSAVNSDIWIGLHRPPGYEDIFEWSDNTPLDFTYWESGEPNSHGGEEDCVHMNLLGSAVGTWNDHRCIRVFPYVCQISKGNAKGRCGGNFVSERGIISSPNYPDKYMPNAKCVWRITVPEGYQVILKFTSFKVEEDSNCGFDYVKILDGSDTNSPVLGKFCGYDIPDVISSSGNQMTIELSSDATYQGEGFSAEFEKATAARVEMESLLRQLPTVLVEQKINKLKKKRKETLKKKSVLLSLKEKFLKP